MADHDFAPIITTPAAPGRASRAVISAVTSIRWGLLPLYLLLWVPLLGFCAWTLQEVFSFWFAYAPDARGLKDESWALPLGWRLLLHNRESFILWALGLIDAIMVANLIALIAIGSYKNFVEDFDVSEVPGIPKWFSHLDSTSLKLKMALSLLGITAVAILRMGMEYNKQATKLIDVAMESGNAALVMGLQNHNTIVQLAIHLGFILTALAIVGVARWAHHNPTTTDHH